MGQLMAPSFTNPLPHLPRMDAENPISLRRLLLRAATMLFVVAGLYVLGVGPAFYMQYKWGFGARFIQPLYAPLMDTARDTPLDTPVQTYICWWAHRAGVGPTP